MRGPVIVCAIAALAGSAAPAAADPTPMVKPPAGWRADAEQASEVAQHTREAYKAAQPYPWKHELAAEIYVPDKPGVSLVVVRATSHAEGVPGEPPDVRDARFGTLAHAAIGALRASPQRASLLGDHVDETDWHIYVAPAFHVGATQAWHDTTSHTTGHARLEVASDGARLITVTGECLASDDAPAALVQACQAALLSVDAGIATDSRIPLPGAFADAPTAAAPAPMASPPASMSAPRDDRGLDDGTLKLPPTAIALDPPAPDRRPMLAGAGIILISALFWWNRRRREQLEREDARRERRERNGGGEPRPEQAAQRSERRERRERDDDDADDLHAAARGGDHLDEPPDDPALNGTPPKDLP